METTDQQMNGLSERPDVKVILRISGVDIYANADGTFVYFVSNLDVCNDGTGPSYGDKHHQPKVAYYNNGKYLNADVDKYVVVPPQIRKGVKPVVMGCKARVVNLDTKVEHAGVVGDIGPTDKTGECAYCLAKIINPSIGHNHGDSKRRYLYELWPGTPATVDGKAYKLQPA